MVSLLRLTNPGLGVHLPVYGEVDRRRALEGSPAIFLDRDGVLVEDVHFLTNVNQLRILPRVPEALLSLQERYYVIVATNQSGIARGMLTEEDLFDIHSELVERLAAQDVSVDALYYCPHLPQAPVKYYDVVCRCRKPAPGMLLRAGRDWGIDLAESFLMGDTVRDLEAADATGIRSIMVGDIATKPVNSAPVVPDLLGAANLILSSPPSAQPLAVQAPRTSRAGGYPSQERNQ